ncbi:hypothetical protein [Niabella beijingensis]|uniref:hypothetical protein n=1 Tax=Niabella beijingensis TaxID=2872700 RepID=UPI001CC10768|nr:hypothetical protein [Niabella beijingensis]MBZ4188176.1 hypothetical protein [Niabella beijingensis]
MKRKLLSLSLAFLLFQLHAYPQTDYCDGVSVDVYAPDPQLGMYNYFGAKVILASPSCDGDVTVTGYIREDGGTSTPNAPFTVVVPKGDTEAYSGFIFQTGPASSGIVVVTDITPCPYSPCFASFRSIDNYYWSYQKMMRFFWT